MANPTGTVYLQANSGYVWTNGDVYEIPQTDVVEGAATGASFSGVGVENQPHLVLLNKIQWLYNNLAPPHAQTVLLSGSGNFTVPASVTTLWVRGWGQGGGGGPGSSSTPLNIGGGGGGGGYFEGILSVTPAQAIAWVISVSTTTFGSWAAGAGSNGGVNAAGAGGLVTGGPPLAWHGTGGETGRTIVIGSTTTCIGGEGGQAFGCGHSHFNWVPFQATNGSNGIYPGQGGGGGIGAGVGGSGGPGMIIVQW